MPSMKIHFVDRTGRVSSTTSNVSGSSPSATPEHSAADASAMRSEDRSARDRRVHADAARTVADVNLPRAWDQRWATTVVRAGNGRRCMQNKGGESDGEGRYYAACPFVPGEAVDDPLAVDIDERCDLRELLDARGLALRERTVGVDEDGPVELRSRR